MSNFEMNLSPKKPRIFLEAIFPCTSQWYASKTMQYKLNVVLTVTLHRPRLSNSYCGDFCISRGKAARRLASLFSYWFTIMPTRWLRAIGDHSERWMITLYNQSYCIIYWVGRSCYLTAGFEKGGLECVYDNKTSFTVAKMAALKEIGFTENKRLDIQCLIPWSTTHQKHHVERRGWLSFQLTPWDGRRGGNRAELWLF